MLLLIKSKNNFPLLISADPLTSDWSIAAYPEDTSKITTNQIIQENLVRKYVEYWFSINEDNSVNESLWKTCNNRDCNSLERYDPMDTQCALYCSSSSELFQQFTEKIIPEYRDRIEQEFETMHVVAQLITPPAQAESASNIWQSFATIMSAQHGIVEVLVFLELGQDKKGKYPANSGYYVQDFNAYRMSGDLGIKNE